VTLHDVSDNALIRDLRRQLDAAHARHGDLEREVGRKNARLIELERLAADARDDRNKLRDRLLGEAEEFARAHEAATVRGAAYWMTAYEECSRLRIELAIRASQLETWLREQGEESTRLQALLTARQAEVGQLERRIAEAEQDLDAERAINTRRDRR
jgi:chromosome segregation ATPase